MRRDTWYNPENAVSPCSSMTVVHFAQSNEGRITQCLGQQPPSYHILATHRKIIARAPLVIPPMAREDGKPIAPKKHPAATRPRMHPKRQWRVLLLPRVPGGHAAIRPFPSIYFDEPLLFHPSYQTNSPPCITRRYSSPSALPPRCHPPPAPCISPYLRGGYLAQTISPDSPTRLRMGLEGTR